jgi:hypothetical protein
MGIFPIIMNIVQFWIIDTIVKASGALSSASPALRDEAEEPFLSGMDDEEDETSRRSEDIEAGTKSQKDTTDIKSMQSKTASTSNSVS